MKILLFVAILFLSAINNCENVSAFTKNKSLSTAININSCGENVSAFIKKKSPLIFKYVQPKNTAFNESFCKSANLWCYPTSTKVIVPRYQVAKMKYEGPVPAARNSFEISSLFAPESIRPGKTVSLPRMLQNTGMPEPSFLPEDMAKSVKITHDDLMRLFPGVVNSPLTRDIIAASIVDCNALPVQGETRVCANSVTEIDQFVSRVLSSKTRTVETMALVPAETRFLISDLKLINNHTSTGNNIVACHNILLPFASYVCHRIPSTKIFEVTFQNEGKMIATCHGDTSQWSAQLLAFVKATPGKSTVCHWMSSTDVLFY